MSGPNGSTTEKFAALIGIKAAELLAAAAHGRGYSYRTFSVPKRMGGFRKIDIPTDSLRQVQDAIARYLSETAAISEPVHGFVPHRSVVSNAKHHCGRKFVLTIDLLDFFNSISQETVEQHLRQPPFALPLEVAQLISLAVTNEGALPQGAPTSPWLSNIVCRTMDVELRRLANSCQCYYTRYADDLVFSTDAETFPTEIAEEAGPSRADVMISASVQECLGRAGFRVNFRKVRLQRAHERQQVCGITVNVRPTVRPKLYRSLRAALHGIERFGLDSYQATLCATKDLPPDTDVLSVVMGRLAYLKMVEGPLRPRCIDLLTRAHAVLPEYFEKPPAAPDISSLVLEWVARDLAIVTVVGDDGLDHRFAALASDQVLVVSAGLRGTQIRQLRRIRSEESRSALFLPPRAHALSSAPPADGEHVFVLSVEEGIYQCRQAAVEFIPQFSNDRAPHLHRLEGPPLQEGAIVLDVRLELIGFTDSRSEPSSLLRTFRRIDFG